MRRNIIEFLLAGISLFLGGCIETKDKKPVQDAAAAAPVVNELPNVILIPETGTPYSASTLPGKTILIFFFTDCDHCQREATDIQKNLAGFSQYNLYFVSLNEYPEIHKFAKEYKLDGEPNIKFFRVDPNSVYQTMGDVTTPTICVYSAEKKLVRRFNGETKADVIMGVL